MIFQADARALPLRDGCVDAVLTSPPYGIGKDYPCDEYPEGEAGYQQFVDFLGTAYRECRRVARGPVAWIVPIFANRRVVAFWPAHPWVWGCPIIRGSEAAMWASYAGAWTNAPFYIGAEMLVTDRSPWNAKGKPNIRPSVFFIPQGFIGPPNRDRPRHPAPFPEEVVTSFLRLWPGVKSLLDPFGGTGTTAVAARRLGVLAFTGDLDPRWTRVQQAELAQLGLFQQTGGTSDEERGDMARAEETPARKMPLL